MNFFGKVFNSLGHAVAWIFTKALPVVSTVAQDAAQVVESPLGTLIAGAFGRGGKAVQADIVAISGSILAARSALGDAFAAKAQDLGMDQKALAAVETLYTELSSLVSSGKLPAPPTPPAAQPGN